MIRKPTRETDDGCDFFREGRKAPLTRMPSLERFDSQPLRSLGPKDLTALPRFSRSESVFVIVNNMRAWTAVTTPKRGVYFDYS